MKEFLEELTRTDQTLRGVIKALREWERLLKDEKRNINKIQTVVKRVQRAREKIPDGPLKEDLTLWLKEAENTLRKLTEEARYSFGKELESALSKAGMKLEGRMPRFRVGPYGIEVDFERSRAKITFGHDAISDKVPLEPDSIVKALMKDKKNIEKFFDPKKSVELVFNAYLRTLKIVNRPMGEKIPIMEVLGQLVFMLQSPHFKSDPRKENYRGLSRAQFAMMLFKIKETKVKAHGKYELFLTTATFDATRKRENFIWVPDNMRGEGTTYAFISFKEAKNLREGRLL